MQSCAKRKLQCDDPRASAKGFAASCRELQAPVVAGCSQITADYGLERIRIIKGVDFLSRFPVPHKMFANRRSHELFRALDRILQCQTGSESGGDGGRVSASGSVGRNIPDK